MILKDKMIKLAEMSLNKLNESDDNSPSSLGDKIHGAIEKNKFLKHVADSEKATDMHGYIDNNLSHLEHFKNTVNPYKYIEHHHPDVHNQFVKQNLKISHEPHHHDEGARILKTFFPNVHEKYEKAATEVRDKLRGVHGHMINPEHTLPSHFKQVVDKFKSRPAAKMVWDVEKKQKVIPAGFIKDRSSEESKPARKYRRTRQLKITAPITHGATKPKFSGAGKVIPKKREKSSVV